MAKSTYLVIYITQITSLMQLKSLKDFIFLEYSTTLPMNSFRFFLEGDEACRSQNHHSTKRSKQVYICENTAYVLASVLVSLVPSRIPSSTKYISCYPTHSLSRSVSVHSCSLPWPPCNAFDQLEPLLQKVLSAHPSYSSIFLQEPYQHQ